MAPVLFTPPLASELGGPIPLACLPTPPALCRLLTGCTAIARLWTPRPEQPFASLEQTTPGPMMTALWPLADVPKRMIVVHGSVPLPLFKSRSEVSPSLRGVLFSRILFAFRRLLTYQMCHPAIRPWRSGPGQRAFLSRFQNAADTIPVARPISTRER